MIENASTSIFSSEEIEAMDGLFAGTADACAKLFRAQSTIVFDLLALLAETGRLKFGLEQQERTSLLHLRIGLFVLSEEKNYGTESAIHAAADKYGVSTRTAQRAKKRVAELIGPDKI